MPLLDAKGSNNNVVTNRDLKIGSDLQEFMDKQVTPIAEELQKSRNNFERLIANTNKIHEDVRKLDPETSSDKEINVYVNQAKTELKELDTLQNKTLVATNKLIDKLNLVKTNIDKTATEHKINQSIKQDILECISSVHNGCVEFKTSAQHIINEHKALITGYINDIDELLQMRNPSPTSPATNNNSIFSPSSSPSYHSTATGAQDNKEDHKKGNNNGGCCNIM